MQGAGCSVQGAGCRVQGAGCWVQGAGCRVPSVSVQGAGSRIKRQHSIEARLFLGSTRRLLEFPRCRLAVLPPGRSAFNPNRSASRIQGLRVQGFKGLRV